MDVHKYIDEIDEFVSDLSEYYKESKEASAKRIGLILKNGVYRSLCLGNTESAKRFGVKID